jgi:hypothetical protein
MTNAIYIDIDTERDNPIAFGKPPDITPPKDREEAKAMVLNDIACVSEALNVLIMMAHLNKYGDKKELLEACIKTLSSVMDENENPIENES